MTVTVSISDFRSRLTDYLEQASHGHTILIQDEKRRSPVAQLIGHKKFQPSAYQSMLTRVAGSLTASSHPEWATSAKITHWLKRQRLASERIFA